MKVFENEHYLGRIKAKINEYVRSLVALETNSISQVGKELASRYVLKDKIEISGILGEAFHMNLQ